MLNPGVPSNNDGFEAMRFAYERTGCHQLKLTFGGSCKKNICLKRGPPPKRQVPCEKGKEVPSSALFLFLFWGEGSPTKVDYIKKKKNVGTLILSSLLEDLGRF